MRGRLGTIAFGGLIVTALAVLALLLPILLPAVAVAEAAAMRRLARTRCVVCGAAIGLAEIRRAAREARARGRRVVDQVLRLGGRPRIVVTWDVTRPTRGQAYEHNPSAAGSPGLIVRRTAG